jgi:hypothetical protein
MPSAFHRSNNTKQFPLYLTSCNNLKQVLTDVPLQASSSDTKHMVKLNSGIKEERE